MKKGLCLILTAIMTISLASCGLNSKSDHVVFKDPVLEEMVKSAMYRTEGDITLEEAAMVTELNLEIEWQEHIPQETQIKDISGLENFTNLENLNLSFHAISDISPLAGLTKLSSLSLGGNPITDISPLSGLTNLTWLALFNCQASDYSPLAKLTNLEGLMLDNSSILDLSVLSGLNKLQKVSFANTQVSDVSPLASLTQLKSLKLEGCPIADYSPLENIYKNLEEKDFTTAFTLADLGFTLIYDGVEAGYKTSELLVTINHDEWGTPEAELENNCVRLLKPMDSGYELVVLYYPKIETYVIQVQPENGDMIANYIYDSPKKEFSFGNGSRESSEQAIQTALGSAGSDDVLLAPITVFNDTITSTFGIDADTLFALPFQHPTLLNLKFTPDEKNAVCIYEQHEGIYINIEVHYPEWGDKDYDLRFFTPVNDYGLVITYTKDNKCFYVAADKGDTFAKFFYYLDSKKIVDDNASNGMSVEEYFKNMYNDPNITDIYTYSVSIAQQYIKDTFGMTIDELCELPLGEEK